MCGILNFSVIFTWYQSLPKIYTEMTTFFAISSSTTSTMNSDLSISANLLPTSSFVHLINLKLTRDNYFLWKAQFFPYLRSQQLMGYVEGSILCTEKMISETIASGTQQVPTPAYQAWLQHD